METLKALYIFKNELKSSKYIVEEDRINKTVTLWVSPTKNSGSNKAGEVIFQSFEEFDYFVKLLDDKTVVLPSYYNL